MVFFSSHVRMWELDHKRRLSTEELMLSNCGAGEDLILRIPQTAWRSNQSILKDINPQYSLEGLMLKLKLQYFGHLMRRTDSLEKTLMLGKIKGQRRGLTEDEMVGWHHQVNGHEFEQTLGDSEGQGSLACCSSWGCKESDTLRLNSSSSTLTDSLWLLCLGRWQGQKQEDKSGMHFHLPLIGRLEQECMHAQSCPTLCDPMDYSLPGSSVHGIIQARILEWVAISFSRRSSRPRDQTCISCIGSWILNHWAIWEALGYSTGMVNFPNNRIYAGISEDLLME